MKRLLRGSLLLAIAALFLTLPNVASAHYTGFPHRHAGYYAAGPYGAPPIDRPGVYLGLAGMGDFVVNQSNWGGEFIGQGGGFSGFLGIRLDRNFAIEFGIAETLHNPAQTDIGYSWLYLTAVTADLKIFFPNQSNVRPFVQGGLGYYGLGYVVEGGSADQSLTSGGGFQLGGGLDIWLNPFWSLGGRLLYHGIYLSGAPGDKQPFLSTMSLEANLQIHF
jgi:hypothetical protein